MKTENLELLTVKEVAKRLDVSDMTIRTLILKGELKSFKIGNQYKIPEKNLEFYLEKRST